MSYQVLARKYRPRSFDTLVGQEHVVRALTHALDKKRLHHAYLFTGTRGVGKTTLSRILAKSFNCQGADGNGDITAQPCGVCDACVSIDAGRFVDYIEMDAASNRGVDDMAQLLEQAVYAPSNARFKVYMIDEVHMLTNQAFNSMLKTLEEPPEHVKFILATTDPQKIPVTVLSRCLQFNLKQMPPGHIVGHLENILGQETIEFDVPALRLLAQGARGSMRDALSLTDQAIAYAAGRVTLEAVQGMLGALDQTFLVRMLDALAETDGAALLVVADDMAARSLSYNAALQDLGTLLHRIALAQTVPAALPQDLPERAEILRLAAAFDAEEVQLFYQIAVHGRNELGLAPDEYAGFTMTLLRMLAFRPGMAPAGGASGSGGQAHGRAGARAALAAAGSASAAVSGSASGPASGMPANVSSNSSAGPAFAAGAATVTPRSPVSQDVQAMAATVPAGESADLQAAAARQQQQQQGQPQVGATGPAARAAASTPPWDDAIVTTPAAGNAFGQASSPQTADAAPAGLLTQTAHAASPAPATPATPATPVSAQTVANLQAQASTPADDAPPAQAQPQPDSRPAAGLSPAMAALAAARGGKLPASAKSAAQAHPATQVAAPAVAPATAPPPVSAGSAPAPLAVTPAAPAAHSFRPAPPPLPVTAAFNAPAPRPLQSSPADDVPHWGNDMPDWDNEVPMMDADFDSSAFEPDFAFDAAPVSTAAPRRSATTSQEDAAMASRQPPASPMPRLNPQASQTAMPQPQFQSQPVQSTAPQLRSFDSEPMAAFSGAAEMNTPAISAMNAGSHESAPAQSSALSATQSSTTVPAMSVMPRQPAPQIDLTVPFVAVPVAGLGWDGNWPQLAASLNLRGVAQQLAMQSELVECEADGGAFRILLRVPVETYRSAANIDKLATAVSEHFSQTVRIGTEIGPVRHTASAVAQAERESRQLAAEETINNDPFVLTLMREFGAYITPGSIRPL